MRWEMKIMADIRMEPIGDGVYRLKVPGGWVVQTVERGELELSTALCFVSDPGYSWTCKHTWSANEVCFYCGVAKSKALKRAGI